MLNKVFQACEMRDLGRHTVIVSGEIIVIGVITFHLNYIHYIVVSYIQRPVNLDTPSLQGMKSSRTCVLFSHT